MTVGRPDPTGRDLCRGPDGSLRIRLRTQAEAHDLCLFFARVGGKAEQDPGDARLVTLGLPGALSPERERAEVAGYLRTWRDLTDTARGRD